MSSPARRCCRLVRLLTVLWAVGRSGATPSQPSGNIDTAFDPQQVLGVIANEVTAKMQPLISQFVSRIDALDSRLASVDSRLASVNNRLDGMETRLTALDFKQDTFAASQDSHSSRMDSTETKLDRLVSQVDLTKATLDQFVSRVDYSETRLESGLDRLISRVNATEARFDSQLDQLASQLDVTDGRLDQVVSKVHSTDVRLDSDMDLLISRVNFTERRFNSRLDRLVSRVNGLAAERRGRVDTVSSRLDGVSSRLDRLTSRTDALHHPLPRDCSELPEGAQSGIYLLKLDLDPSHPPVSAYCDLNTDGGGWTVIQRRRDVEPRQNFNRNWTDYREGFGDLHAEFWWGLRSLWRLTGTADRQYELRVNLADFDGESRQAAYREFRVTSEADGYRLAVSGYQGNAGDSLQIHNGKKFSTIDRDQDEAESSCARSYKGGWWFYSCYRSFLNGVYLSGEQEKKGGGVIWIGWRGNRYSLKDAEMKIRPVNTD